MARWLIRCYGNERRNLFDEEYSRHDAKVRAEFRATLNGLRDQPRAGWSRPDFDMLSKQYRELGKLRFKAGNAQHRPLGFFGPGVSEFTLLIWATERDGKYHPPGVRYTALERMNRIKDGKAQVYEFDFEEVRNGDEREGDA
jgi:hypothetical protein